MAEKEWIQHYFNYVSRGTIAEDAEILLIPDPIVCRCGNCGKDFEIESDDGNSEAILCPGCLGPNYTLLSGTAFRIEGIEVI